MYKKSLWTTFFGRDVFNGPRSRDSFTAAVHTKSRSSFTATAHGERPTEKRYYYASHRAGGHDGNNGRYTADGISVTLSVCRLMLRAAVSSVRPEKNRVISQMFRDERFGVGARYLFR